jgi:hypothetical protein
MSRMLYQLSYPAKDEVRAPNRNRTDDLFLTMETLYRLSYGGLPLTEMSRRQGYR